jgi:hypothetical protein
MSLINEALKKAQRQRSDQQPGVTAGPQSSGAPVEKRGKPMRAQSLLMLGAAATVLIVLSVVVTVYLVNRQPPQLSSSAPAAVKQVIRVEDNSPSPVIVAPAIQLPVALQSVPEKAAATVPEPAKPVSAANEKQTSAAIPETSPTAVAVVPKHVAKEPTAAAPPAPQTTQPPAPPTTPVTTPATFDPRVLSFVDAIRVTGIRSSGNESKVLMNDRVYRVNDIVDRALALKLVKVESDMLTFTDAKGVVYTKNF